MSFYMSIKSSIMEKIGSSNQAKERIEFTLNQSEMESVLCSVYVKYKSINLEESVRKKNSRVHDISNI